MVIVCRWSVDVEGKHGSHYQAAAAVKSLKQFHNLFSNIADKNTLITLKNISPNQIG